jgi:protein-S-isoprenylcysteine O-methyltransferase Ste14
MIRGIIQLCWLIFAAYWLISARRVKPAKQTEGLVFRLLRIGIAIFVFWLLLSAGGRIGWLGRRFVPPSNILPIVGAVLTALGVAFAVWARYVLGKNWSAAVTIKESHELIGSGPYARIRHPIYSGVVLALLGTALAIGEWRGLLSVFVAFFSFLIKARKEEALLSGEFGSAFEDHLARTGMFFPRRRP